MKNSSLTYCKMIKRGLLNNSYIIGSQNVRGNNDFQQLIQSNKD